MLFSDYSSLYTTAFVEFNQRLPFAKSNFIYHKISKHETFFRGFVMDIFALRKIYAKTYAEDMHTEILQPKVEIIYDLLQNDTESVRNGSSLVAKLIEEMFSYCESVQIH